MAQATPALSAQSLSVQQVAAEIVSLINRSPVTPTAEQIASMISAGGAALPSIATAAAEIKRLQDMAETLDGGETQQEKNNKAMTDAERFSDRHLNSIVHFEMLSQEIQARKEALERMIMVSEAETADEALALLLIATADFDTFAANHTDHRVYSIKAEGDRIEAAMQAVLRFFVNRLKASSPMLGSYGGSSTLKDRHVAIAEALKRAQELDS